MRVGLSLEQLKGLGFRVSHARSCQRAGVEPKALASETTRCPRKDTVAEGPHTLNPKPLNFLVWYPPLF